MTTIVLFTFFWQVYYRSNEKYGLKTAQNRCTVIEMSTGQKIWPGLQISVLFGARPSPPNTLAQTRTSPKKQKYTVSNSAVLVKCSLRTVSKWLLTDRNIVCSVLLVVTHRCKTVQTNFMLLHFSTVRAATWRHGPALTVLRPSPARGPHQAAHISPARCSSLHGNLLVFIVHQIVWNSVKGYSPSLPLKHGTGCQQNSSWCIPRQLSSALWRRSCSKLPTAASSRYRTKLDNEMHHRSSCRKALNQLLISFDFDLIKACKNMQWYCIFLILLTTWLMCVQQLTSKIFTTHFHQEN